MENEFKAFILVDNTKVVGFDLTGMRKVFGKKVSNVNAKKLSSARGYFEGLFVGYYDIIDEEGGVHPVRLNLDKYSKSFGNASREEYEKGTGWVK